MFRYPGFTIHLLNFLLELFKCSFSRFERPLNVKAKWWGCQGRVHSWSLGFFHFSLPLYSVSVDVGLRWQTSRHTCWHSSKTKTKHMWNIFILYFHTLLFVFATKVNVIKETSAGKWVITSQLTFYLTRNLTLTFLSMSIVY